MKLKPSFSLIEIVIVMMIMSILMLIVVNFLINSVRQSNQLNVGTEIRNEANLLIDKITSDVHLSRCECVSNNVLQLYGVVGCPTDASCTIVGPTPYATYRVSSLRLQRNSVVISSDNVKVQRCTSCSSCPGAGFVVQPTPGRTYDVTLYVRQADDNPRSDFCGRTQIKQVLRPRN